MSRYVVDTNDLNTHTYIYIIVICIYIYIYITQYYSIMLHTSLENANMYCQMSLTFSDNVLNMFSGQV